VQVSSSFGDDSMAHKMVLAPYNRPLLWAMVFQVLLVAFYWTALDLGQSRLASAYASVIFWLGVIVILIRRRGEPTGGDLAFVRWGLLPIGVLGSEAILLVWQMRGM
jgi:hypothetical protein